MVAHQIAELTLGAANFKNAVHPQEPAHNKANTEAMIEHCDLVGVAEAWNNAREGIHEALAGTTFELVESSGSVVQIFNSKVLGLLSSWDRPAHGRIQVGNELVSDGRRALSGAYEIKAAGVSFRAREEHWAPHRRDLGPVGRELVDNAQHLAKNRNRTAMSWGPRPKVTLADPNSFDHWLGSQLRGRRVQYCSTARDLPDQIVFVDGRHLGWRVQEVRWVPVPYTDHLHDGRPSGLVATVGLWTLT